MKNLKIMVLFITMLVLFNSCKDYFSNSDPLIDIIEDYRLDDPAQIPFLIAGLKSQFATATNFTNLLSDILSDQLIFNFIPTDPPISYLEIDEGRIELNNTNVTTVYRELGEARFYADNLVERVLKMGVIDQRLKEEALFTGKFYGGYTRFLYAAYFGLSETNGGSPVNGSKFISSNMLYTQAINLFKEAIEFTVNPWEKRLANSMIAKSYLFKGDYSNATIFGLKGLINGDNSFQIMFGNQSWNTYYSFAGFGRRIFLIDDRFPKYILTNPEEASRIKIDSLNYPKYPTIYFQAKYPTSYSPEDLITWQENNLMLAELALRNQASAGNALALVNDVRLSHNISLLNNIDLETIYIERDKELFCTGNRLPDERRFQKFHLPAGRWQYLPVPAEERELNHNL